MTAIKKYVEGVIKKRLQELCKVNFYGGRKKNSFSQLKVKQCETPKPVMVGMCINVRATHPQAQLKCLKTAKQ